MSEETIEVLNEPVYKLNTCGEDIHYNGDEVAVFGNFDSDGYTVDAEKFEVMVSAIENGCHEARVGSIGIVLQQLDDHITDGRTSVLVEYERENGSHGSRSCFLEGLRALLDKSV